MDALRYEVGQRLVDGAVAHDLRLPAELRADDVQREVTATGVAGMARVQRTVVANIEARRLQCTQSGADFVGERHEAGRVLRKGLTVTLA